MPAAVAPEGQIGTKQASAEGQIGEVGVQVQPRESKELLQMSIDRVSQLRLR